MAESSEDSVDEQLESRFPQLHCEEVDELFEGVARGKTAISNFQTRKIVAENKTILEMTLKTAGTASATSPERTDEVIPFLERVAKGELDLKEFTVRNVLKGETYLRLELAPKEGVKKEKKSKSKKKQQQQQKKSKKEIQDMESELSFLQTKLDMMQKMAAGKHPLAEDDDAASGAVAITASASSGVTAATKPDAAAAAAAAAAEEVNSLAATIERFTSRAKDGALTGRGEGHVPYEVTPELESLEKKSEQIGSEIIELLKEAEALIASKEEEEESEHVVDIAGVAQIVDVSGGAVAGQDGQEVTAAAVNAAVAADAGDGAALTAEALDAQMKAHVASLEQESSEMEENIMRLINTVNSMAKRVEEKKE